MKKQENDGVGDISSLFQRHCQTNGFLNIENTIKMSVVGICFNLYFFWELKLNLA